MQRLKECRVVITGAGSGLGRALALLFARDGWRVACSDLHEQAAQDTAAEIRARGGPESLALRCDVTADSDCDALAERVREAWGGIDVWINNAGVATAGTVADTPLQQWHIAVDVNLLGCVRGVRAAIPLMLAQGAGHIVNVASFAGIANPPALAAYNATKAAVISLSETLRFEMAAHGIGVTVACPSFFNTNLLQTSREITGGDNAAPQMEQIVARLMDKSDVTAEDVADDILLAVAKNRFMVITHPDARTRHHLKRYAPELFFRIARRATRGFLRKTRETGDGKRET